MTYLKELLDEAQRRYEAMTPEQQAEMWRKQKEGYVRSVVDWPKPNYKWADGVKV